MKTNRIAIALFASVALMLSSCDNREKDFEVPTFGDDEVAFKISEVKTRSVAENQPKTLQLGSVKTNGQSFTLEDEVTSLDIASEDLATRGTPAFTENVKKLYGTFYTVAIKADDGKAAFKKNSDLVYGVEYTNEKDNIWHYHYGEDIWEDKLPTYFFMRMPGAAGDAYGVSLDENSYDLSDGSITFDYKSPSAAASQKDILFTSYKRTKETNCEDIVFYHALTGVKFSNYFDNKAREKEEDDDFDPKTTRTYIKQVKISGIKSEGTCTVIPAVTTAADGTVTFDDTQKSCDVVEWNDVKTPAEFTITAGSAADGKDTTNYKGGQYGLDNLLDKTAAARNINDADGTMTFWFIPQDLTQTATDSVIVEVTFDIELEGELKWKDVKVTANLSKLLKESHRVWEAGQLHTFTLRPNKVGVDIDDKMTKYVKSDVVVENTGNVYQYVRVNMIANWWGNQWKENDKDGNPVYYDEETILFGYTTSNPDNTTLVEAWNCKDGKTPQYGEIVGLVQKSLSTDENPLMVNNWVRFDKYYYYTLAIGPGDSVTDKLFEKYEVSVSPEYWIPDVYGERHKAGNVHLKMDLMVQAIEAPVDDSGNETSDYKTEWAKALANSMEDLDGNKL